MVRNSRYDSIGSEVIVQNLDIPQTILQGKYAGLYQVADIIPKAVTELMDVVFVAAEGENTETEE